MNLVQFRTFNVDRVTDIDELVAGVAFGKSLRAQFESLQLAEPDYIDIQLKSLHREIANRVEEQKAARIRTLAAQINTLKSRDEKRAELEAELAKLNGPTVTVT
jgi:hypothetical protein